MALYGTDFIRTANKTLACKGVDIPDVKFQPHGCLYLFEEELVDQALEDHKMQIQCGAKVELLRPKQLKFKFPWLNTHGIAMGSYGYENEGWFDPWALLGALKLKCQELGVQTIEGEVHNCGHDTFRQPGGPGGFREQGIVCVILK